MTECEAKISVSIVTSCSNSEKTKIMKTTRKQNLFAAVLFAACVALFAFSETAPAADAKKPNIVFMFVDNVGYGELGCYGGGIMKRAPHPS